MTARYPITLDVEGRRCVVLGGGDFAHSKASTLLGSGAQVTVVAERLCPSLQRLVDAGRVQLEFRAPNPGDLAGAFLAIDTTGDSDLNRACWREAEQLGVLLNVLDRPEYCHFAAPALVRRGPLTIAVSTAGESPYIAASVRARLERTLGAEWGAFVTLVGRIRRRFREQGIAPDVQSTVYRRLLQSEVRSLLAGDRTDAAEFEAASIAGGVIDARPRLGRVTLVGAGPGDPGLLTLKGQEAIFNADVVFHDALVDPSLLALGGNDVTLVDVGKRAGRANPRQDDINDRMIQAARSGEQVVRLKGGDPFIFGRGGEEVAALTAAGIDVVVIPGVSSAAAAPAAAGIPLTFRGLASSVAFVTARTGADQPCTLTKLADAVDTLVILMPLRDLEAIALRLAATLSPEHPAALVCAATLPGQRVIRASLATIATASRSAGAVAPATLIVGHVTSVAADGEITRVSRSIAW